MSKKVIVNKFGGGILKKELIPFIEKRLQEQLKNDFQPVMVVSALPKVTDELLSILEKLKTSKNNKNIIENFTKNLFKKHLQILSDIGCEKNTIEKIKIELVKMFQDLGKDLRTVFKGSQRTVLLNSASEDKIVAYGEKLSSAVFSSYFQSLGFKTKRFLAEEIPIITDDNFKNANIQAEISTKNVQKLFSNFKDIAVIPGFTGITNKKEITTLGRGGTDTTACFIGGALKAEKIILWKDVGGVLSADPKIVKNAKTIPFISYQESEEAGKIIHDKAIKYAMFSNIPIEIVSLADSKMKTIVGKNLKTRESGAKIVSFKKNLILFLIKDENLKGNELLSIVSNSLTKNKVDVILISNTRYSLQIVAENNNGMAEKVFEELQKKVFKIEMNTVNMVFLIGNFKVQDVNDFNSLLIKLKTNMEISAFLYKDCTRLEAVIKSNEIEKIINALHKKFIK